MTKRHPVHCDVDHIYPARPASSQTASESARSPTSRRLDVPDPLRDKRGDTVTGHRDAIQRVGNLHRALLVGDDDQLARVAQLLEPREQPAQVGIIEGGLDLVHDVAVSYTHLRAHETG